MLKVEQRGSLLHVTLNRPEVRNALSDELIHELKSVFSPIPHDVRAVLISGEGPSFCAGGDLEWMRRAADYSEEQNFQDALALAQLFEAMVHSHALVIAKVHGHAFGGGAGLVAACDVAIVEAGTLFSFSETKLGLVPATIARHVLPKIGVGNARWLFPSAEIFDSTTALRIGLAQKVATKEELDEAVHKTVKSVLAAGPRAVNEAKQLAREPIASLEESARLLSRIRASDEAKEGIDAFLNKRKASFYEEN